MMAGRLQLKSIKLGRFPLKIKNSVSLKTRYAIRSLVRELGFYSLNELNQESWKRLEHTKVKTGIRLEEINKIHKMKSNRNISDIFASQNNKFF